MRANHARLLAALVGLAACFACTAPSAPPPLNEISATILAFVTESTSATLSVQVGNGTVTTSRDSVCLRFLTEENTPVMILLYLNANGQEQHGEFSWMFTAAAPNLGFVADADDNGLVSIFYGQPQGPC